MAALTCHCGSTWWRNETEIQITEETAAQVGAVLGAEYLAFDKRYRLRCAECGNTP